MTVRAKNKGKELFLDAFFFLLGSALYAVAVKCFTAPNHIAPGGITGLSTVLNYLLSTPIGVLVILLNTPIFIWAIFELGYKMVVKTIAATVLSSVAIDLLGLVLPAYEGSEMLAAIFGGALEGIGLSCIFVRGATTGGTDMIARLLGRRFRHISMGKLMLGVDAVVVIISAVAFQSLESALYAFIAIFVSTRLIDSILYGTDAGTGKVLFIISEKSAEITQEILKEMDRGVTILKSRGAYSGREGEVLLSAVRRDEVHKVRDIIHDTDPNAFLIVGEAGEISGEGFRELSPDEKTLKELLKKNKEQRGK